MMGIKKHGNRSKHSMHLHLKPANVCYSMLAAVRNCCIKQVRIRHSRSSASKTTTAGSLGQAVRNAATVETLSLEASPDLLCMNLMCEKVGDPCICRLSVVLEKLHHLEGLNLSGNKLISLPESVGQLQRLRYLDLSNNRLQTLPNSIQYLKQLEVLNLKGNPQFVGITDLKHLHSLKQLHLDDDLAIDLPAELTKLAQ